MNTNRMAYLLMLMALAVATLLHKHNMGRHNESMDRALVALQGLKEHLEPTSSVKVEVSADFAEFLALVRYVLVPVHLDVKGDMDTVLSVSPLAGDTVTGSGRQVLWQAEDDRYIYTLSKH